MNILYYDTLSYPRMVKDKGHQRNRIYFEELCRQASVMRFSRDAEDEPDVLYDESVPFTQFLEQLPNGFKPDVILFNDLEYKSVFADIAECPVFTAYMINDPQWMWTSIMNLGRCFDALICGPYIARRANACGLNNTVPYLYIGIDESHFDIAQEAFPKTIDISFIGNVSNTCERERIKILTRIASLSGKYSIRYCQEVTEEEYFNIYRSSKIVINRSVYLGLNPRVIESYACWAVPFLEEENQEVRDVFEPDTDIVLYREDNVCEKIAYWLENPNKASELIAKGRAKAAQFTIKNNITQLLEFIQSAKQDQRCRRSITSKQSRDFIHTYVKHLSQSLALDNHAGKIQTIITQTMPSAKDDSTQLANNLAWVYGMVADISTDAGKQLLKRCLGIYTKLAQKHPEDAFMAFNTAMASRAANISMSEYYFSRTLSILASRTFSIPGPSFFWGEQTYSAFTNAKEWLYLTSGPNPAPDQIAALLSAKCHLELAVIYDGCGLHLRALNHYQAAVAAGFAPEDACKKMGEIYLRMKMLRPAIDMFIMHCRQEPYDQLRLAVSQLIEKHGILNEYKAFIEESAALCACFDFMKASAPFYNNLLKGAHQ